MKIKVAILGTGNIGTDLLIKAIHTNFIDVVAFVGRRFDSDGMNIAKNKGIFISDKGIEYFIDNPKCCDIVYDCTNAADAIEHAKIFKDQNIKVIDLTPAKVGEMCVPDINGDIILYEDNVNMITCGGQASMPILYLISKYCIGLDYVEIVSQIASKSAGMATRINVDNYIYTTQKAISKFTGCNNCKVILNLNPADPCVDMQTTIFVKAKEINLDKLQDDILNKIQDLKKYIPHYELILAPILSDSGILSIGIKVRGSGDYLPEYAGNLDIINCAAIEITKKLINNK